MKTPDVKHLKKLAALVRYFSLVSTTEAGSGHPTSSLSAADLMTALFFGYFRYDFAYPENPANDRLIFSKGHASPLYYALFAAAGKISLRELLTLRRLDSPLEGHPTREFLYTEVATGSLGQGLSVGVGEAIALRAQNQKSNSKSQREEPRVYVLLGDGEMAEGSVWEALACASHYKLGNLVGILDVNRLGQSQATMLGHDVKTYEKRVRSFGWNTIMVDGHNLGQILDGFANIKNQKSPLRQGYEGQAKIKNDKPTMIIAKTIKGKGVSFLEDKDGWHGKALDREKLAQALEEIGEVDLDFKGEVQLPAKFKNQNAKGKITIQNPKLLKEPNYKIGEMVATREAYGEGLVAAGARDERVVVLDGDTKNSTYSEKFLKVYPERFFEMFIAEQNMVGAASGLARRGFKPFASTFSAFFTRAFDQVRMAALSKVDIKLCGSHAGVSIGEDGASQMGLEDLAMTRAVYGSTVLYPGDAVSTLKLVGLMKDNRGVTYMRTTRGKMPVIYGGDEEFRVGGSKVHKIQISKFKSQNDNSKFRNNRVTVIAAGITLHEALAAQKELAEGGIETVVVDCYSVKPIDVKTIRKLAGEAKAIITVEDHWNDGGLGDAVLDALAGMTKPPVYKIAVFKMAHSGKPEELVAQARIDKKAIVKQVKDIYHKL